MADNRGWELARTERTRAVTGPIRETRLPRGSFKMPPCRFDMLVGRVRTPRLPRTARAIQLARATGISRPNLDPPALPGRSHDRQARGLRFLRSTANRAYDHKSLMKTPDFRDRLTAPSAAKKAQLERARTIADDPERLKRIEARSQIIAARNNRIAERERDRREAIAREVAARAVAEAAEAAAREAARQAEEEAQAARLAEQERLEAAEAAKREIILAARRAGRKAK
jgi:hypothetical protein